MDNQSSARYDEWEVGITTRKLECVVYWHFFFSYAVCHCTTSFMFRRRGNHPVRHQIWSLGGMRNTREGGWRKVSWRQRHFGQLLESIFPGWQEHYLLPSTNSVLQARQQAFTKKKKIGIMTLSQEWAYPIVPIIKEHPTLAKLSNGSICSLA